MAKIPQWVLGRNWSSIVLTPQTVSGTDGTLADTTPVGYLTGRWRSLRIRASNEMEEVSAADLRGKNWVAVATDLDVEVAEITQLTVTDANPKNPLFEAAYGMADVFKVTATRSGKTYTMFIAVESFEETGQKGSGTGTMTFKRVDVASTANPAIT